MIPIETITKAVFYLLVGFGIFVVIRFFNKRCDAGFHGEEIVIVSGIGMISIIFFMELSFKI